MSQADFNKLKNANPEESKEYMNPSPVKGKKDEAKMQESYFKELYS